MATCKFNVGDEVKRIRYNNYDSASDTHFNEGEVGEVVGIDEIGFVDVRVNGKVNYGNDPDNLERVNAAAPKFKVGDKVIGNHPSRYGITNEGWIGEVTKVRTSTIDVYGHGIGCDMTFTVDPKYFDLYDKTDEKIVITHDGKTTTATKYCADGSTVTATARCAPEDEFNFEFGAKLALERLTEKTAPPVECRVVDRKAEVGDYIRLKTNGGFDFSKPGDILKVDAVGRPGGTLVRVYGRNHPRDTEHPNELWNYLGHEYEVVEKVIPGYYNGKVVCVENNYCDLTVGKIYEFVNGIGIADKGNKITNEPVKDVDDLNSHFIKIRFIEVVE